MKVLKDGGYIFWEVPNGNKPGEGPHENEIHIPHTYYYTKEYFDKKYKNIILNEVFDQSHIKSKYSDWKNYTRPSNVGEVIRVIHKNKTLVLHEEKINAYYKLWTISY